MRPVASTKAKPRGWHQIAGGPSYVRDDDFAIWMHLVRYRTISREEAAALLDKAGHPVAYAFVRQSIGRLRAIVGRDRIKVVANHGYRRV